MQALDYIHVKNSFAHKDTLVEFKPGRNYIIGNYGSGKSELIEMIGFALFGTVSLRGKANTYPKLEVELKFNHLNTSFIVRRNTSDATLSMYEGDSLKEIATSTTGVNQRIIAILGYDYNIYLLSNYCQQGKLQYFSELTPAKRLQFINKVSGIEDAKELIDWLNVKRKELKSNLDTLQDMLHKPVLSSNVSLDTDYKALIDSLSIDLASINRLNTKLTTLRRTFKPIPPKLTSPSREIQDLAEMSEESKRDALNKLRGLDDLFDTLEEKQRILKGMISCPPSMAKTNLSLESAEVLLNQVMMNSLQEANITCPSCSHSFSTSILHDHSDPLSTKSVKDLSNYIAWLQPDVQREIKEIQDDIDALSDAYDSLSEEELLPGIRMYDTSYQKLSKSFTDASMAMLNYQSNLSTIEANELHNEKVEREANQVQEELDKLMQEQSVNSNLKAEYTAKKVEKDLYLKQVVLYEEALEKHNKIKEEFDIVLRMLKDITSITNTIKLETIPLINHHASNYLNLMTQGVMNEIQITDNYDLIVDGHSINLRSGAQKDISSLAFRLSLGQSIILGMLPLFIGDEIDASSPTDVAGDITNALETMSTDKGYQIIMITHKDTANLEDCNIINLG